MSLTLDTFGFSAFIADLAKISGRTYREALLHQTARVLELAIKYTPEKTATQIRKTWLRRANAKANRIDDDDATLTYSDGSRGGLAVGTFWLRDRSTWNREGEAPRSLKSGRSLHDMNGAFRWNDGRWATYQVLLAEHKRRKREVPGIVKRHLEAKGLVKKSWLQIAEQLGIAGMIRDQYARSASARVARSPDGKTYHEGEGRIFENASTVFVEIMNSSALLVNKLHGARILQRAIDTRLNAFLYEMQNDVFKDLKFRASRYPGLFTQ